MAELGYQVLGLDVDKDKIDRLANGDVPFFEPGLQELLRRNLAAGRLGFTSSYEQVGNFGDVHFICVGTPQKPGERGADLSYLDSAIADLAPHLRPGAVVVGKSTVPSGTADRLADLLAAIAPGVELCWNPEFLREGFAIEDTLRPDRLVLGIRGGSAQDVLRQVYAPILDAGTPLVVTDFFTAELVKVAANAFLATKISFINAMAEVCEAVGADVTELAEALSYDTRIGGRFLTAGLGFGGGCLPKDIRAFAARADELGLGESLRFLAEVDAINLRRRDRVVALTRELLDDAVAGARVTVLGGAFKPNSDDIRDSPALDVAARLHRAGAVVTVYDPAAMDNARRAYPELCYAPSAVAAAAGAEVVLMLTEWQEFRDLDPDALAEVVAVRSIVDGRNALDREHWRARGWIYRALGRA